MYNVTWPDELRAMCIRFRLFTSGSQKQYEKLFEANRLPGWSLRDIAVMIWICSESHNYHEIMELLEAAHDFYEGSQR